MSVGSSGASRENCRSLSQNTSLIRTFPQPGSANHHTPRRNKHFVGPDSEKNCSAVVRISAAQLLVPKIG